MSKDLANNIKVLPAMAAGAIVTNTTTVGVIIDTKGYGSLCFTVMSGAYTDGTYTPKIEEGNDASLTDKVDVAAQNLSATLASSAISAANTQKDIGYRVGNKRYVRLSLVSTAVTTGASFTAVAILGSPDLAPV